MVDAHGLTARSLASGRGRVLWEVFTQHSTRPLRRRVVSGLSRLLAVRMPVRMGNRLVNQLERGVHTHIYDLGKVWAEKVVGWGRIRVGKVEEGGRRRERACGSMRFLKGRGLKAGALMGQKEHAHPHTCARAPRSIDQQRTGNELSSSVQSEGSITL